MTDILWVVSWFAAPGVTSCAASKAAHGARRMLTPVRERYAELRPDEAALEAALAAGAEKARSIAAPVVAEVRERMGFGPA